MTLKGQIQISIEMYCFACKIQSCYCNKTARQDLRNLGSVLDRLRWHRTVNSGLDAKNETVIFQNLGSADAHLRKTIGYCFPEVNDTGLLEEMAI